MDLAGANVLVVGATSVLGGRLAELLHQRGARLALAGRNRDALASQAENVNDAPALVFDAYDTDMCAALPAQARRRLGGLDGILIAIGAVAFAPPGELPPSVTEHLLTINTLAPIAVLSAGLEQLDQDGFLAALTGIIVDQPHPQLAEYSAAKAGLATWLAATQKAVRGSRRVLDLRAPHMDTGLVDRAVHGTRPQLPAGADIDAVLADVVDACADGSGVWRHDER